MMKKVLDFEYYGTQTKLKYQIVLKQCFSRWGLGSTRGGDLIFKGGGEDNSKKDSLRA